MTAQDIKVIPTYVSLMSNEKEDEFSIPLDIFDIISVCKEYNRLGWHIQNQIESILEVGIEESINSGVVKQQFLPHIKNFLRCISDNPYFGDAVSQAKDCIKLIAEFEERHKIVYTSISN